MPTDVPVAILFANSRYAVRGRPQEGIGTVADLATWLRDHLDSPNVTVTRVDTAIELRDAIRSVFHACVTGEPPPPEALAVINKAAASAPSWPELSPSYELSEQTASEPLRAALAHLARDTMSLLAGPHRADLRACLAPGCVKYFLKDHHRREWCCDHCGNRARAARHYQRHRASSELS